MQQPKLHQLIKYRPKLLPQRPQRILHLRHHHLIYLTLNNPVPLKLLQTLNRHLI